MKKSRKVRTKPEKEIHIKEEKDNGRTLVYYGDEVPDISGATTIDGVLWIWSYSEAHSAHFTDGRPGRACGCKILPCHSLLEAISLFVRYVK